MQDSNIQSLLDTLLSRIHDALKDKLVGLYLYGSLATGDFDPDVSDIDLLAAISSDLADAEFKALNTMHDSFARQNPQWDDRIDVAYLSVEALQTFRTQPSPMAAISGGEPFHTKPAGSDWLLNWYQVRETGVTLLGPPPTEIIPLITGQEFVQSVKNYAAWWASKIETVGERKEQAYAILTMCRALYAHQNGEQASKRRAALWAQAQLPEWSSVIQHALEWRAAWREQHVDHDTTRPETIRFVHFVGDLIHR